MTGCFSHTLLHYRVLCDILLLIKLFNYGGTIIPKKTKSTDTTPKPQKHLIPDSVWIQIATCPVCGILLERDEPYRVGWIKHDEQTGGYLSIRGHKECVSDFYRQKESDNAET